MVRVSLSLLVLPTADLAGSLRFYEALGLQFAREQHGNGPVHYACELADTVLQLYPAKPGSAPDPRSRGATRTGFQVESVSKTMSVLAQLNVTVLVPPDTAATPSRAVVQDLDGRAIDIQERS